MDRLLQNGREAKNPIFTGSDKDRFPVTYRYIDKVESSAWPSWV